jgi:hypothetical protein
MFQTAATMILTNLSHDVAHNISSTLVADCQASLAIFTFLLVVNMLMAIVLNIHNQHRSEQNNVLLLLQTHMTNIMIPIIVSFTVPIIVRLLQGPISHVAAELAMMTSYTLLCHLFIVMTSISILKLLLVIEFPCVFNANPLKLSSAVGIFAAIVATFPNVYITAWNIFVKDDCCRSSTVAYLTGSNKRTAGLNLALVNMATWMLLNLALILVVIVGIPVLLKKMHTSQAIRQVEK